VALTGFCPAGSVLRLCPPMLGSTTPTPWNLDLLQTDRWYLERRIYIVVGVNISVASILVPAMSPWWMLFTFFVGGAMVWLVMTLRLPFRQRGRSTGVLRQVLKQMADEARAA
jgi:hypothetical protein